jgi:hypothetical protein
VCNREREREKERGKEKEEIATSVGNVLEMSRSRFDFEKRISLSRNVRLKSRLGQFLQI